MRGVQFKVVYLEKNVGHGLARKTSLEYTHYNIIALMDSDDICVNDRFEKELEVLIELNVDIVVGDIAEFIGVTEHIVGRRVVHYID